MRSNSPWKHRHSPKRIGSFGLEKKNKHLHRTSCGWSPTSASWCMTSRGLSESTTSRKPGVRIGLRLPTLRTSTEKLSTRQRPYFNPPKCPANKSLNILNMGLGFFQTISSFPGSSFLNLDHGEEIEQLFQYLVLTTVFLYPQKSRAMQDSPAVGRWPWFVSFPLVYQAFAWPNQCRIHSFWMTTRSLFSPSTQINDCWLFLVASSPYHNQTAMIGFCSKWLHPTMVGF